MAQGPRRLPKLGPPRSHEPKSLRPSLGRCAPKNPTALGQTRTAKVPQRLLAGAKISRVQRPLPKLGPPRPHEPDGPCPNSGGKVPRVQRPLPKLGPPRFHECNGLCPKLGPPRPHGSNNLGPILARQGPTSPTVFAQTWGAKVSRVQRSLAKLGPPWFHMSKRVCPNLIQTPREYT